jgi:hypothetical protein
MNPYTYSKKFSPLPLSSSSLPKQQSLLKGIAGSTVSPLTAFALIGFIVFSLIAITHMNLQELSPGSDMPVVSKLSLHKQKQQVLGAVTYPSTVLVDTKSFGLEITPLGFQNGWWNYKISWRRTLNRLGSLTIDDQMFVPVADKVDSEETGFQLEPGEQYEIKFYSKIHAQGTEIATQSFTVPLTPPPTLRAVLPSVLPE